MAFTIDPQYLLSGLNWQQPSWDVFAVLFFIVAAFIYGLALGRDRIILNIISLYLSLTLVDKVPFLSLHLFSRVPENQHFIVRISLFIFILIVLFFLFSRSAFFSAQSRREAAQWWQVLLLSVFQVGLLISSALSFLPNDILSNVPPLTMQLFGSQQAEVFWLVSSVVIIALIREPNDSSPGRYP